MQTYTIEVVRKLDKKFLKKWEELWQSTADSHFFNSPTWFTICLRVFNYKDYYIFVIKKSAKVEAIFPLVVAGHYGVSVLRSPGGKYQDKSTLLTKSNKSKVITCLIKEISKYGHYYLSEVSQEISECIDENDPNYIIRTSSISPYLLLGSDPFRFLSTKKKNKIRNKYERNKKYLVMKHLNKINTRDLEVVFKIDSKSSKSRKGKESFSDLRSRVLIKSLLENAGKYLVVDLLYFRKRAVAYTLGFKHKDRYQGFQMAYVSEFKALIPGKILIYLLFKKLQQEGVKILDFGRGESEFKLEFTPYRNIQYDIYYTKSSLVRVWWLIICGIKSFILDNQSIYKIYCRCKEHFHLVKNFQPALKI